MPGDTPASPRRPSLRELEVLRAVIVTRKTTAAAQRLGMSQPAVSRAIGQLEARTGRALFRREGGRLVPTADALALDEEIEPILAGLARLDRLPWAGRDDRALAVIAPPTITHHFLDALLAAFLATEPGCVIQLELGTTSDVVASVADGKADLGLTDSAVEHAGVRLEPFRRARLHAVLPAGHPLAGRDVLTPPDFRGLPFIVLTRRFPSRAITDRLFEDAGIERRIVAETATSASACALVKAGIGHALLNPFPLSLTSDRGLVFRPFAPEVPFQTSFVVSTSLALPPAGRRFMDFMRANQPADRHSEPIR